MELQIPSSTSVRPAFANCMSLNQLLVSLFYIVLVAPTSRFPSNKLVFSALMNKPICPSSWHTNETFALAPTSRYSKKHRAKSRQQIKFNKPILLAPNPHRCDHRPKPTCVCPWHEVDIVVLTALSKLIHRTKQICLCCSKHQTDMLVSTASSRYPSADGNKRCSQRRADIFVTITPSRYARVFSIRLISYSRSQQTVTTPSR